MVNGRMFVALMVMVLALAGCRHNVPPVLVAPVDAFRSDEVAVLPVIEPALRLPVADSTERLYDDLLRRESVIRFYELTGRQPVWVKDRRRTASGDSLVTFIRSARRQGLLPQHYHATDLMIRPLDPENTRQLLRQEVLLTDAFLAVAKDLNTGRLSEQRPERDSVYRQLLARVAEGGEVRESLLSLESSLAPYRELKGALNAILDTCSNVDRALLMGGVTLDTLALHQKVRTIEINLERWRQERRFQGARYIYINIPAFMARLYEDGRVILESKVIVGTPKNPTPRLSSVIQCFISYPYWHVPRKIAVEELLPSIQRDRAYLDRNNFDVLDRKGQIMHPDSIDWAALNKNNFPYRLRQREGADNSLGVLKFEFDNPYAVFLHDTNAKRLFQNKTRAFSHGCIRMEKALELAHYLVTDSIGGRSRMLEKYLHERVRHTIDVARPLPIYVRYITAEVIDGSLYLYNDLYKEDKVLAERMYPAALPGYY